MDILAHSFYGVTLCSRTGLAGGRRGRGDGLWYRDATVWWALFFSVLPDAVSMWVPFTVHVFGDTSVNFFRGFGGGWLVAYRYAHSLVPALTVSVLVFGLYRRMFIPSLAWAVHVVCDAVSHGVGKFQNMPFYPVSRWGVEGIAFWRHPGFVLGYWAGLVLLWVGVIIWRRCAVAETPSRAAGPGADML